MLIPAAGISNPSISVPATQVNDNYCDCPDGSDEPGTPACAHLAYRSQHPHPEIHPTANHTLAFPGFYCKNKNHNPSYLPFTHVDDGICDYTHCCDGSDEAAGICPDKCKEIGQAWRQADEKRQLSLTAAGKKRVELVAEAAKKRTELHDWIRDAGVEIAASEVKIADLEKEKDKLEKEEKSRVVRKQPSAGKVGILAGLAKEKLEQWRASLDYLKKRRDEEKSRAAELEDILAKFKEEYNPNFNDEGVKRAVRAYEEYAARENKPADTDASERDATDLLSAADHGIPWSDFETPDLSEAAGDIETLYAFEEYLPSFLKEYIDGQLRTLRTFLIQNGILADTPASSTPQESQALRDARAALTTAQNDLSTIKRKKQEQEDSLVQDFGPQDVFRTMKDRCIATDSGEYTYELCWLGQVTQKPKKGGAQHNMGRFNRFENVTVDEDVTAEGKGLGTGERLAAKHEGGATCWQGPPRSTAVIMACAENEEIWKVMEEEKCVYRLEVGTPAVCRVDGAVEREAQGKMGEHGEL